MSQNILLFAWDLQERVLVFFCTWIFKRCYLLCLRYLLIIIGDNYNIKDQASGILSEDSQLQNRKEEVHQGQAARQPLHWQVEVSYQFQPAWQETLTDSAPNGNAYSDVRCSNGLRDAKYDLPADNDDEPTKSSNVC